MTTNVNPTDADDPNVFITTADLSASKPPPQQDSFVDVIARMRAAMGVGIVVYLIYLLTAWNFAWNFDGANLVQALLFGVLAAVPYFVIVTVRGIRTQNRTGTPVYRDIVYISDFTQTIFLIFIAGSLFLLLANLVDNLAESQLQINFNVLGRTFGVEVTEGPDYDVPLSFLDGIPVLEDLANSQWLREGTYFRALMVGLVNTLRVVSLSLIFATILGILLGIGLLSENWLVKNVSSGWVEVFRNTPLLVQLFFIYRGVLGFLPNRPSTAIQLPGDVYLSSRGLNYPAILGTDTFWIFGLAILAGIAVGAYLWRQRLQLMERTGTPANTLRYFLMTVFGFSLVGLALAFVIGGAPLMTEAPSASRFNFRGGSALSAEYLALMAGLVFYTSAFIADIVRAGILSVPKGQLEAAGASGLTSGQTLQLVILPQALRLIVPPLTNQYLNLAKNSSLAIAIGFFDVYNVANVAQNQSGQAVALFAFLMVTYLLLSLIISLFMNLFNNTLTLKTR